MKTINIKTIRIDGGTQSRVEINNELVQEYAQAIDDGAKFPPVVIFNDGVDNWLADGFHRFHAHGMASKTSILADIRTGSKDDALWYSVSDECNGAHGQRLSNADKRKKVLTALEHPKSANLSDNAIAKHVGVSVPFVGTMRSSLLTVNSDKEETERTYTTKHGTKAFMKTGNIGKKPVDEEPSKPVLAIVPDIPVIALEDEYTPLDEAHDQIQELRSMLAVANMGDVALEDKDQATTLLAELRSRIKTLEATLKAVTISRDTYMNENAELRRQITRQRREIDRALGSKTA